MYGIVLEVQKSVYILKSTFLFTEIKIIAVVIKVNIKFIMEIIFGRQYFVRWKLFYGKNNH